MQTYPQPFRKSLLHCSNILWNLGIVLLLLLAPLKAPLDCFWARHQVDVVTSLELRRDPRHEVPRWCNLWVDQRSLQVLPLSQHHHNPVLLWLVLMHPSVGLDNSLPRHKLCSTVRPSRNNSKGVFCCYQLRNLSKYDGTFCILFFGCLSIHIHIFFTFYTCCIRSSPSGRQASMTYGSSGTTCSRQPCGTCCLAYPPWLEGTRLPLLWQVEMSFFSEDLLLNVRNDNVQISYIFLHFFPNLLWNFKL